MAWMTPKDLLLNLPQVLFGDRMGFTFDGIPLTTGRLSFQKRLNLIKVGLSYLFRSDHAWGLPPTIQIEPTNACNLKCPLCPTGAGSMKRRQGFMEYNTFEKILNELGHVLLAVILYGWGEPFLNKDAIRMIEACTARDICTVADSNGHSLQTLDDAMRVVESGLSAIIIALDGSTQEIYQAYRKGGEVNKVRRCAALIEEAKSKRGSRSPYTCLRAVVTCDNETDLAELEALSRDLGVDMFSYKTLGMQTYDKIYGEFEPKEPHMKRFEYSGSDRKPGDPIKCPFPFRQPTVFWDGTVVGCEYDYDLDMTWGKIGKDKFSDIINSPQARRLRRRIRNGTRSSFCHRVCPFQDRVQDECYLCCKALGE